MKKRVILTVLALSLVFCSCGKGTQQPLETEKNIPEQSSEQEKEPNFDLEEKAVTPESAQEEIEGESQSVSEEQIMQAYEKILKAEQIKLDSVYQAGKEAYGYYVYGDLNQDGIVELMVLTGSCEADENWKCYSYHEDSAYQIGDFPGGHMDLCSGNDGIYSFYAQMGYVEITKVIWGGGTEDIRTEVVYTNDINDMVDENYDALMQTFGLKQMELKEIYRSESLADNGKNEGQYPELSGSEAMAGNEAVSVVEGSFWEGDKSPTGALYYIEISNCTSEGFDFEIFGRSNMEESFSTVFKHHTAVYTSPGTAIYDGQNYTLTFRWTEQGYLSVDGFAEWIPSEDVLYNSDYLGVS